MEGVEGVDIPKLRCYCAFQTTVGLVDCMLKEGRRVSKRAMKGEKVMGGSGFLGSLFDFSFTEFVTTKIIKILYGLCIVFSAIGGLAVLFSGLAMKSFGGFLLAVIGGPLMFLLYVIISRVWLELVIVIFRIAENTTLMVAQGRQSSSSPPTE